MINPYANVDWANTLQVKSVSHVHAITQAKLNYVAALGYEHIPISHYNPSEPMYPLDEFFDSVPDGVFSSPNTEKVRTGGGWHINGLGSFATGHGWEEGSINTPWRDVFTEIFAQLQYADGGGVTLNHPTDKDIALRCAQLDFDDRVLGIEVYNNMFPHRHEYDNFTDVWDAILKTGRRCWGFSVIDWPDSDYYPLYGANIMLVDAKTGEDCLKAYRKGEFYAIKKDTGLRFASIVLSDGVLTFKTNSNANFKVVTDKGVVSTATGMTGTYQLKANDIYVRVEAVDANDANGVMWSQPIMQKTKDQLKMDELIKKFIVL